MMLMKFSSSLLAAGVAAVLVAAADAQVQTATSVEHGVATSQVTIERGEVVYVSGNDVMIKMNDGSLRHFPDVPESARIDVDGSANQVRHFDGVRTRELDRRVAAGDGEAGEGGVRSGV